jgi:hypothetical protein
MRLISTGKNPCEPLAGIRDRDRRPCEGSSKASATQPVVSARTASRRLFLVRARSGAQTRGAAVRSPWSNLPYALCAMPVHGPVILTHGCAMIFGSSRQYVKLLYTSQMAWRATPMGIDRTNLSCRTILFFFALLVMPKVAISATLEDAARELARKVAAALPPRDRVSIEMRNISSLAADEVVVVEQTLTNELQDQTVRAALDSATVVNVRVTLSQNIKHFLWIAEVSRGDSPQVVLLAVPRSSEDRTVSSAMPMTLRSEKFWEGSQRILDAILAKASNGDSLLILLTRDGIQIREIGSDNVSIVPIPVDPIVRRDPLGGLEQTDNGITFKSVPQVCHVDADARALIECHHIEESPSPGRVFERLELAVPGPSHVERGTQITALQSSCRSGKIYLAAGTGDYTESDTIELFESTVVNGIIVEKRLSDFLHLPGPVIALQFAGATPRAIVRNLQTGNYEAYSISVTCAGQ